MILLNKEDIKKVFTMKDAIEANKECYALDAQDKFVVPLRPVIPAERRATLSSCHHTAVI